MGRKIIKQAENHEAYLSVSYKAPGDSSLPLLSANADKNLFEMFMANSQTGSWVYDENDIIVFANKAYTDSTNFEGDPIGLHLSAVFPEKLAKKLIARNKEILKHNKPAVTEHSLTKSDGTVIHFVSNTFVFTTADGKRFIGGQAVDITARKEIEKMHDR